MNETYHLFDMNGELHTWQTRTRFRKNEKKQTLAKCFNQNKEHILRTCPDARNTSCTSIEYIGSIPCSLSFSFFTCVVPLHSLLPSQLLNGSNMLASPIEYIDLSESFLRFIFIYSILVISLCSHVFFRNGFTCFRSKCMAKWQHTHTRIRVGSVALPAIYLLCVHSLHSFRCFLLLLLHLSRVYRCACYLLFFGGFGCLFSFLSFHFISFLVRTECPLFLCFSFVQWPFLRCLYFTLNELDCCKNNRKKHKQRPK